MYLLATCFSAFVDFLKPFGSSTTLHCKYFETNDRMVFLSTRFSSASSRLLDIPCSFFTCARNYNENISKVLSKIKKTYIAWFWQDLSTLNIIVQIYNIVTTRLLAKYLQMGYWDTYIISQDRAMTMAPFVGHGPTKNFGIVCLRKYLIRAWPGIEQGLNRTWTGLRQDLGRALQIGTYSAIVLGNHKVGPRDSKV